jgi:GT2 family glycosyltransferase
MESVPKVAILVLNYNGTDCLPRCLTSLRTLEYSNFQVVVIDNGSQDQSFEAAKKNFPENIFLKKETNTGFAAGMNTGIQYAQKNGFDFVWLMNYDAEVYPDTLSKLIVVTQENTKVEALSPVIQDSNGHIWFAGGRINYLRMRTEHQRAISQDFPYATNFLTGCAPLLSLRLLEEVGAFDERFFLYYEDAELSARIQKYGYSLWVVPEARVVHAEKSSMNPQKLYYLVHYGLLFFALHTPKHLRLYIVGYVTIRRLVNQIKLLLGLSGANLVAEAYADYFRKFQAGDQLYLRKLS